MPTRYSPYIGGKEKAVKNWGWLFSKCVLLMLLAGAGNALAVESASEHPSLCKRSASAMIEGLKRLNATVSIYKGSLLKDLRPEEYAIFEKTRLDPLRVLTEADRTILLRSDLLKTHEQWRSSHALAKKLNVAFATWYRSTVKKESPSLALKVAHFLFPITPDLSPAWSRLGFETTQRLVKKVLENPDTVLAEEELLVLRDIGKLRDFRRFQADLQNGLRDGFVAVSEIKARGKALVWTVAGSAMLFNLMGEDPITRQESVAAESPKAMTPLDDKVELIFTSPLPQSAVRIGGQLFSYPPPSAENLGVTRLERISQKNFREETGNGKALAGNHIRVELKLTNDEREKLRDSLEEEVGAVYPFVPPLINGISQTGKAIRNATGIQIPPVLDRTQSGTLAYLKLLKLLGNEKIGDIRFAGQNKDSLTRDRLQAAAANLVEGAVFFRFAGWTFLAALATDGE